MIEPMLSTPALILVLGNSMLPALAEVKRIHLQSDARRAVITRFLVLRSHARRGEMEWIPIEEELKNRESAGSWREVLEKAQTLAESLQAGIRSALHELRSHERLIEVGLGDRNTLPLDVYLIADLTEPEASVLLTVMPIIQSLLADEPYAALHLLLNIAVFDAAPLSPVHVHVSLERLRRLLQAREPSQFPQIYLFDRFKEGIWEAQDLPEIQTILGNFLLALLSGGLARRITHQLQQADVEQYQAYFCGASAAVVLLDMEQLQRACALRLGREIIENEFHSKVDPNPGPIDEMSADFVAAHANPLLWRQRLCRDTLFRPRAGDKGLEFHIADLKFEDVPMDEWGDSIRAYDGAFRSTSLPAQVRKIGGNLAVLGAELSNVITEYSQALPRQTRLYPGGVRAARLILDRIRRTLLDSVREEREDRQTENLEQEWAVPIQTSLEWLENALRKLPKPPGWISRLPVFLKKPALQLFDLIYRHRDLRIVTDLREASLRLLERKYESLVDAELERALDDLQRTCIAVLEKQIRSLKRLQSRLDKLPDHFAGNEIGVVAGPSLFRLSALNETLLAWAYYRGRRPPSGFRQSLLVESDYLGDWQKTDRRTLSERLLQFCRQAYHNLSDLDLEEVLAHRNGNDATDLASALKQGAIPLLRPDFDQTGGGPSYQMRFFLSCDTRQASLLPLVRGNMQEWQEISTGDPYLVICSRVRLMVPFSSLHHVFERGREAFNALDEDAKGKYLPMEPL
jgi:hypothetical protein